MAYAAISAEITDLISGEKHLKEQEIRLAFALRKTDSMIWEIEFSEEGIFLAEMYGKSGGLAASSPAAVFSAQKFTPESLLSRGLIHPDSARELHRTLQALERGVTGTQCQLRLKDSSGEYRWTQVYFNTVFDETGRPLRAFGVTKDINREKELEQRLAMERQYRESLTNDTMCVYEASLTRDKLLNSSREWSEMLGLSPTAPTALWWLRQRRRLFIRMTVKKWNEVFLEMRFCGSFLWARGWFAANTAAWTRRPI